MTNLKGISVAILVADGFEQSELLKPKQALEKEGAKTFVISPAKNKVKGWKDKNWGDEISVDVALDDADPNDYDALLLPGGVMNPDALRINRNAIKFIKTFVDSKKPIAAICHGPWTLIDANGIAGKTMTSWPSIKADLVNAGAKWVDRSVVCDQFLVTSRKPEDIPDFNAEMIKLFFSK
jgi:protease I